MQFSFDDQFDRDAAAAARDDAIARVGQHANPRWIDAAYQEGAKLARTRAYYTTDEIHFRLAGQGLTTPEPRAMGAVMRRLARDGMVAATDRTKLSGRVACHRRPLRVWRSLVFKGTGANADQR